MFLLLSTSVGDRYSRNQDFSYLIPRGHSLFMRYHLN